MTIKYCNLCERAVEAKRVIGVGTLILCVLTGGLWLFTIPFYSKRCAICKADVLTDSKPTPKQIDDSPTTHTQPNTSMTNNNEIGFNPVTASKYHRYLIYTFAAQIIVAILVTGSVAEDTAVLFYLPFLFIYAYFTFRLARALGSSGALWGALAIIPIINWFSILLLLNKCNKKFKSAGIKISFWGGVIKG